MRPPLRFYGPLMVSLVAGVAIFAILTTAGFQSWVDINRRDAEAEMIFRGTEIARALKRFQQDQGRLPAKLEELMEPGNRGQYFLRRPYKDPLVKDGEWGLLYAAPGGGVFDPNAPGAEQALQTGELTSQTNPGALQNLGDDPRTAEGLPVAGVRTLCTDRPFRLYKGRPEYETWLFSVFDIDGGQAPQGEKPPDAPLEGN